MPHSRKPSELGFDLFGPRCSGNRRPGGHEELGTTKRFGKALRRLGVVGVEYGGWRSDLRLEGRQMWAMDPFDLRGLLWAAQVIKEKFGFPFLFQNFHNSASNENESGRMALLTSQGQKLNISLNTFSALKV